MDCVTEGLRGDAPFYAKLYAVIALRLLDSKYGAITLQVWSCHCTAGVVCQHAPVKPARRV